MKLFSMSMLLCFFIFSGVLAFGGFGLLSFNFYFFCFWLSLYCQYFILSASESIGTTQIKFNIHNKHK
jgi:hypothetical protein